MAAWLIAAVERLPPRARRTVLAAAAVLLLVGAITSLTLEASPGGGARRRAPARVLAVAPGASSIPVRAAGEPSRFRHVRCALPAIVAARFLVSYLQFAYGRGSAGAVKAVTPGLRSQLISRARSGHAGRARPPPARCVAGHGRNDARVRRGDGDYRGRRDRGVPAAVHASGAGRPLVGERRAGGVSGGAGRDPPARRPGPGGRGGRVPSAARRRCRVADGRDRRDLLRAAGSVTLPRRWRSVTSRPAF